jgi:hypothetical protein
MTSAEPPRVATWLLRHLGCSQENEAVVGDIIERYQQGHSRLWYWWQVAVAIVTGFVTEVRLHKLVIVRGLLVGSAFQVIFSYGMHHINHLIFRYLLSFQRVWEHPNLFAAAAPLTALVACAINGRLLARLHRSHGRAVILAFLALQFLTMWIPIGRVPLLQSWILQVGFGINALIFQLGGPNGSAMPLLNAICDICATGMDYRILHLVVSALIAATTLLVGSGLLRGDSNGGVQRTRVPA